MQNEKLLQILGWFAEACEEEVQQLVPQSNPQLIKEIEDLVEEPFPEEIRHLYQEYNGDDGEGFGSFLGHPIISLEEMKSDLALAKTMIKPKAPKITNPTASNAIIEQLTKVVIKELPLKKKFGFLKPKWHRVEFDVSPGSLGGPYFYPSENTTDREREPIDLSGEGYEAALKYAKELHELEKEAYNWGNLEIIAYQNGQFEAKRTFHNFDEELPLTSTPEGAIKKKYFHLKWLPIISDYGGNFIGIDLDPDEQGAKGQVIIFGRDEEDMLVLANSWNDFLDWNLALIKTEGEKFSEGDHLHDLYRKIMGV